MAENISSFNPLALAILLGAISLLPLLLMITTSFLKISMVLMLTRNAIGVQQTPPNMALYGIALAATLFVMAPVFDGMQTRFKEKPLDTTSAERLENSLQYGIKPLTDFMLRNSDPDLETHLMENSQRMWTLGETRMQYSGFQQREHYSSQHPDIETTAASPELDL